MSDVPDKTQADWLKKLDQKPEPILITLACVVVVVCAACIILRAAFKYPLGPEVFGSLVFAGLTLGGVAWYAFGDRSSFRPGEAARLLVLIFGGSLGFGLALATIGRIVAWWEYVAGGLETWQGQEGWRIWLVMGMGVVSCAIMFGSLLLARTEEQSNPIMRRLLYGYVTWLTAFLLLIVLLLVNLLVYNYLPNVADYTNNKIYTLTPRSQEILKGLKKPVTVIALVEILDGPEAKELQNLDDNCRRVTDRIHFEYVVRDRNRSGVQRLVEKYKIVSDLGLLVIYGDEDAPNTSTQFIKLEDLFASKAGAQFDFKGEDLLMTAIDYLDQDKSKPVLYFTQNNGEYDLGFSSERVPEKRRASVLRQRLEKANYEVKGLRLTNLPVGKGDPPAMVTAAQVPEDAAAVIVLSPTIRIGEDTVKALEGYMNPSDPKKKKGKLIVMLDVDVAQPEGTMRDTGLDPVLGGFGVEITKERILSFSRGAPADRVYITGNPEAASTNPVAAALQRAVVIAVGARPVQSKPIAPNRPGASPYQSDEILVAAASTVAPFIWAEPNLTRDPNDIVNEINDDPKKLEAKNPRSRIAVGMAVSESGQPDRNDPHAFMQPPKQGTPRLLAFGNASFLSDTFLQSRQGPRQVAGYPNHDVFESSLAWLRERPSSIGLDPKERKIYQIEPTTNFTRMEFLPLGLMIVTVLGLGLGVWVVRRR